MTGRRRTALIVALLLGALASSCRSGGGGSPFGTRANRPVRLQVENHNFLDVTIYATGSGASLRLGEVTGKSSGNFTVDPRKISMASGLQFRVDPLGSTRTFLSRVVFPDRAATVILTVAAELEYSYVTLRYPESAGVSLPRT